jgi:putative selenium metabolism protein SsnA
MNTIIKNGYIITHDYKNRVYSDGAIYFENDKIVEIGSTDMISNKYGQVEHEIDADGRVVMPGLINAHMHFYSAFATGMSLAPFPPGFVNVLENLWWKIDRALLKDDVYYSALLGYIQAVRSGTTTVIDHHASPSYITGSLDGIDKAGRQLGVRSSLCYEVTDRNGQEGAEKGLKENERYIKKTQNDDLFSGLLGLHASFTVSNDSLDHAKSIVKELDTGIHVHVAEGKADMTHARENFDKTVLQRFESHELLNSKSILAHGIHLEDVDYGIMKKHDINITHQPRSNMNNAVGMMDFDKMLEKGVNPGLGTDGMSADMKAEVMVGPLLQKHHKQNNLVGFIEPYNALIEQNPAIIKKLTGVDLGKLMPNFKADIMISDYRPKTPISSDNIAGHFMFGIINEPVHSTIINGEIRMLDHKILNIDERAIHEKSMELAQGVWNRVVNLD